MQLAEHTRFGPRFDVLHLAFNGDECACSGQVPGLSSGLGIGNDIQLSGEKRLRMPARSAAGCRPSFT